MKLSAHRGKRRAMKNVEGSELFLENSVYIMERQNGKHIVGTGPRFRGRIRYLFDYDRERSFQARDQDQFFPAAALHHQIHPPVPETHKTGNRQGRASVLSLHYLR
jgi:hypothetical protein